MMKYIGKGNWLPNIPSRDLTDDEVKKYGGAAALFASGLYAHELNVKVVFEHGDELGKREPIEGKYTPKTKKAKKEGE